MKISTWQGWARAHDAQCRRFEGYGQSSAHTLWTITSRPDFLRRAGFSLVTGGMMGDCSRRTAVAGVVKSPRSAVADFIEAEYPESEIAEVVYFRDPNDYYGLYVWIRRSEDDQNTIQRAGDNRQPTSNDDVSVGSGETEDPTVERDRARA